MDFGLEDYWLATHIGSDNQSEALQSSLNWPQALAGVVLHTHGDNTKGQNSSLKSDASLHKVPRLSDLSKVDMGDVFGSLFRSTMFTLGLNPKREHFAWEYYGSIVQWYYACYNSLRSINLAHTFDSTDKHAQLIKKVNDFRSYLPHPLNMVAVWEKDEIYSSALPGNRQANKTRLLDGYDGTLPCGEGMLLSYLSGTCRYEVDKVKAKIASEGKFSKFNTKDARICRNNRLPQSVNFLNCAYRYRGKANYRDAIFLGYGRHDVRFDGRFIRALHVSAVFLNLVATAYLRRRLGDKVVDDFKNDISRHMRHLDKVPSEDRHWDLA